MSASEIRAALRKIVEDFDRLDSRRKRAVNVLELVDYLRQLAAD